MLTSGGGARTVLRVSLDRALGTCVDVPVAKLSTSPAAHDCTTVSNVTVTHAPPGSGPPRASTRSMTTAVPLNSAPSASAPESVAGTRLMVIEPAVYVRHAGIASVTTTALVGAEPGLQ